MLINGDCLKVVEKLVNDGIQVDSIVTDPPYHLTSIVERFGKEGSASVKDKDGAFQRQSKGFMGKEWDGGDIAFRKETWELFMKVLKPGGHLLAFSGSRTYHRMAIAIENAGFDIRDQIMWLYGSGFPKSLNIGKAVDKKQGNKREVIGTKECGYQVSISKTRKETLFIQVLEGLHKDEAELLINVKDKRLHQVYKGVSSDVVKEAFDWDENFKVKGV